MAGKTEILGIGNITNKFKMLAEDMKVKTARRMVASAGSVLKKEAKVVAQSKGLQVSGALIRNIAIKRESKAPVGTEQYHLGVRHGRDLGRKAKKIVYEKKGGGLGVKYANDPFYWRFVERGHKIVRRADGDLRKGLTTYTVTLRNGKKATRTRKFHYDSVVGRRRRAVGFVEAIPFIAPALINKKQEAIAAMEDRLLKDLAKASK